MKNYLSVTFFLFTLIAMQSCSLVPDSLADAVSGATKTMAREGNSLFHQTETVSFKTGTIEVTGEVKEAGMIDFDNHYLREVMIKETTYEPEAGIVFIGAYRYRGYSLFDLLHPFHQNKKNMEEFRPAIDLYIVIENALGETVTFSWSEIFHTNIPHQIMIATEAAPIVPYKREVDYATSENWRVVAANDLFAWRVLDNPVKISVRSFDKKKYEINRDLDPLYSGQVNVVMHDEVVSTILPDEDRNNYVRYYSSFYGMGMGYHEAAYFEGPLLNEKLQDVIHPFEKEWNRNGLVCFAAADGYRTVFSFSELFNRADQVGPILAVPENPMDGGFYRIFHPAEFYADRSAKSLQEIYFFQEKN